MTQCDVTGAGCDVTGTECDVIGVQGVASLVQSVASSVPDTKCKHNLQTGSKGMYGERWPKGHRPSKIDSHWSKISISLFSAMKVLAAYAKET